MAPPTIIWSYTDRSGFSLTSKTFAIPSEGIDSGIAHDFNPEKYLQILKAEKNGKI